MKLYFDLEVGALVASNGVQSPITSLALKRGDTVSVVVAFCRGTQIVELGAGATGKLGIKKQGDFDGDFLAYTDGWTKTGSGTTARYTFDLDLNTAELNEELGVGDPDPDVSSIVANFELEFIDGGVRTSSQTIAVTIHNDVIKGNESSPSELPDEEDWLDARGVRYDKDQSLDLLAQARARRNLSAVGHASVEAVTSGDSVAAIPTVNLPVGTRISFDVDGAIYDYILAASFANTPPVSVRPLDYHGTTNQKAWLLRGAVVSGLKVQGSILSDGDIYSAGGIEAAGTITADNALFTGAAITLGSGSSYGSLIAGAITPQFWTLPNATGTIALTSGPQTFSGNQTFTGQITLSGQSATAGGSAMTRDLCDLRYLRAGYTCRLPFGFFDQEAVSSSGSTVDPSTQFVITAATGTSNSGTAIRYTSLLRPWIFAYPGNPRVGLNAGIDWSKKLSIHLKIGVAVGSDAAIESTTEAYWRIGMDRTSTAFGALTTRGVALYLSAGKIVGQVHNGTSLTTGTTALYEKTTAGTWPVMDVEIRHIGSGTYQFWVNGTLKDTLTGGPKSPGQQENIQWAVMARNGASSTQAATAYIFTEPTLTYWE